MNPALVLAVLLCSGCAAKPQMMWTHPHGSHDMFNRDLMQCQAWGAQMASYRAATGQPVDFGRSVLIGQRASHAEAGAAECMQRLGYTLRPVAE